MTDRMQAAVAELVDALRAELQAELSARGDGPPELLSIEEAGRRLGIGRTAVYEAIGRGELRSVRIGRRRLIAADALRALIGGDQP